MSLDTATLLTTRLLAFTLALQGIEIFIISRKNDFQAIWSSKNLVKKIKSQIILAPNTLAIVSLIQIFTAIFAFIFPHPLTFIVLWLTHFFICLRFLGTFNGGSDMMAFVALTGVLITLLAPPAFQKFGLIYIGIHAIYSYFKAGLAKVIQADWRRGEVLNIFLTRSLVAQKISIPQPQALILCWLVMIFELSSLLLLILPQALSAYFTCAVLFHFIIFLSFGLNRFFWIWLCAWPSIFYLFAQLTAQN